MAVNARIEYIEGYSGHADQEWLMNFIYSFIKKPKHIFLVHGEEESEEILREKIETETGLNVTMPEFGETYELTGEEEQAITRTAVIERKINNTIRSEIMHRLGKIKDEINDMDISVKEDMNDKTLTDRDIFRINEKIKALEKQILNVIEG